MRGATNSTFKDKPTLIASGPQYVVWRYGHIISVNFDLIDPTQITGLPRSIGYYFTYLSGTSTPGVGTAIIRVNDSHLDIYRQSTTEAMVGSLIYITNEGGGRKLISRILSFFRRCRR